MVGCLANKKYYSKQRRIVLLLELCLFFHIWGSLINTVFSVTYYYEGLGQLFIRIYAIFYGIPLVLAFMTAITVNMKASFPGRRILNFIVMITALYWIFESIVGLLNGNEISHWISNTFNFMVPIMVYISMQKVLDINLLDELVNCLIKMSIWIIPFDFAMKYYVIVIAAFQSAGGGAMDFISITAATAVLHSGKFASGGAAVVFSILGIIFSLKRASWLMLPLFPLIFTFISNGGLKKAVIMGSLLVITFSGLFVISSFLPERYNLEHLTSRVESLETETNGFTSGQAREDEIISIWEANVGNGSIMTTLFGRGMGASYDYYMASTYREIVYDHFDTHFTPVGWFLRGGIFGTILSLVFYLLLCYYGFKSVVSLRRYGIIGWPSAYFTYFLLAIFLSMASFSLTPNPTTHIIIMMIIIYAGRIKSASELVRGGE